MAFIKHPNGGRVKVDSRKRLAAAIGREGFRGKKKATSKDKNDFGQLVLGAYRTSLDKKERAHWGSYINKAVKNRNKGKKKSGQDSYHLGQAGMSGGHAGFGK